jgi:hypothetical protein
MLRGALLGTSEVGAREGLPRVTDWSAEMTNGLPVTRVKLASVSSHATVPVLSGEGRWPPALATR